MKNFRKGIWGLHKNDKREDKVVQYIYCMMYQALDDSDQTRKYGISESIIQALIMTLLQTMSYYRACIMDQRCHTFLFSHNHQVPGASCGILYILVLSLVIFMQSLYTLSNL